MAKKSRKRAVRYSELSKSRKKRQASGSGSESQVVSTSESQEVAAVVTKESVIPPKSPAVQKAAKTQPGVKFNIPDYKYVRNDLKRVGILTIGAIVIIIILAFVLR